MGSPKDFLIQISFHFIQTNISNFKTIRSHLEWILSSDSVEDCQIFPIFKQSEVLLTILNERQFWKRTIQGVPQQITDQGMATVHSSLGLKNVYKDAQVATVVLLANCNVWKEITLF